MIRIRPKLDCSSGCVKARGLIQEINVDEMIVHVFLLDMAPPAHISIGPCGTFEVTTVDPAMVIGIG